MGEAIFVRHMVVCYGCLKKFRDEESKHRHLAVCTGDPKNPDPPASRLSLSARQKPINTKRES